MKDKKKRFLSVLLVFTIILSTMSQFAVPVRAEDTVIYDPVKIKYPVFNGEMFRDQKKIVAFYTDFAVISSYYNTLSEFKGLAPNTKYKAYTNVNHYWEDFLGTTDSNNYVYYNGYGRMAQAGHLEINLSAFLGNDKHEHTRYIGFQRATSFTYHNLELEASRLEGNKIIEDIYDSIRIDGKQFEKGQKKKITGFVLVILCLRLSDRVSSV